MSLGCLRGSSPHHARAPGRLAPPCPQVRGLLQTQAFAYLARRQPGYDPYDLRIVPAAAVRKGRLQYLHYTISEAGVTQFVKVDRYRTDAQFTPLVEWRREAALYKGIMSLPFFRDYFKWRSYGLWRKQLSAEKRRVVAGARARAAAPCLGTWRGLAAVRAVACRGAFVVIVAWPDLSLISPDLSLS